MSIVIDASIALKWVIPEPGSEAAGELRSQHLIAPTLWIAEAANALWRLVRRGEVTPDQAFRRYAELADAPVAPIALEPHVGAAFNLATRIKQPIYDCLYLAVALHHDTHVVTADRRFAAAVRGPYPNRVRLLGAA